MFLNHRHSYKAEERKGKMKKMRVEMGVERGQKEEEIRGKREKK
jgi:hypothetical protein